MKHFEKPNIIEIIVHDLGTRLGCYGETTVETPNLDAFAGESIRFTHHFSASPYCCPSRGSIVTGKYPHVNGLTGLVPLGWNLPDHNVTLARILKSGGYETYLFGHQHEVIDRGQYQADFDYMSDESTMNSNLIVSEVNRFLADRQPSPAKPFFARIGFWEVHRPYEAYPKGDPLSVGVPGYLADTPGAREDLAMFHGSIKQMDQDIGQILNNLEKAGLKDNTIVVFTTDHGIDFPRAKGTLYDPGINTTLLVRWPQVCTNGRVVTDLLSNIDLFPTLLEAAGMPTPNDIQGRSFLPLLQGEEYTPRSYIFSEKNEVASDLKRCVRTKRHKYIQNFQEGPLLYMMPSMEASLTRRDMGNDHFAPRPRVELYDLDSDPLEFNNLAGLPEVAHIEKTLADQLRTIMEETADFILAGPIARPKEEEIVLREKYTHIKNHSSYPREGLRLPMELE
ncbi:sulfatase [Paenibacillus thalictri]|nr:sulfatase [Paenibacillus thalictri]